jgi:hypothetical protein
MSVNAADSDSPAAFSERRERKVILLLCCIAAIHVFIFSAAFPFFNNVDELANFDLVIKYSQGHIPHGLKPFSIDTVHYDVFYNSIAFLGIPADYPGGQLPPPPWTHPSEKIRKTLMADNPAWRTVMDYETGQPPLYYALAGLWWHVGQWCGFEGGRLLYWIRFLNVFIIAALVWVGYVTARIVFPENLFLRLGVPALLAFISQTAFYSIQNDVLAPLCFGVAFIFLANLLRADIPNIRLGIFTGLALAAVFLTKMTNLPLLVVSLALVLIKILRLEKAGKLRASLPSLTALAFCAALPIGAWMLWCKINFGDFTGSEAKIEHFGWTRKPFGEWWHHPIFTPHGLWFFMSNLMATFWRGEFQWHHQPLASPVVDFIYVAASLLLLVLSFFTLFSRFSNATYPQREALCLGFMSFIASVAFLAFLSIIFDFNYCPYPSREHPYFISGRLILGALIPFLLLFIYALDRVLKRFGNPAKFFVLTLMILFMLISEIVIDWPVFSNDYNWFHM